MKSGTAGAASGCVIWAIVFGILATCLGSAAMMIGGITSGSDLAARTVGPMICPDNTRPRINTYATTSTDDYGNTSPATGYELQCLDKNNSVVKTDPVGFAFYWMGLLVAAGAILAALLAFVVAGPAGVLIARLVNKNRAAKTT
jgi:hypothetical protein